MYKLRFSSWKLKCKTYNQKFKIQNAIFFKFQYEEMMFSHFSDHPAGQEQELKFH